MRGYYKNPEETAKAFTPDGWLRTGDIGVLTDDGRLRMVGRTKDVFRVGGENVAPAEVEEVLLAHPAVATAQVVGVPDARLGEVGAAFVTLKAGHARHRGRARRVRKRRCANFRVPRYLAIVESFDAIGMTASGKVQKNRLREHAIETIQARCRAATTREQPDDRRHSLRVLRARRLAARGRLRGRPTPSGG